MSFLGSIFGTDAADSVRNAAEGAYNRNTGYSRDLRTYGDSLPGRYDELSKGFDPYISAGGGALARLMTGLGLPGGDGGDFTAAYRATPGYSAGLETGTNAARRSLNAGNMGQSGGALKALMRYGADYEDQKSGEYFNRLGGVANAGQAATGAKVATQGAGIGADTDIRKTAYGGDVNSSNNLAMGEIGAAQTQQSAINNLLGTVGYLGGSFLGGGRMPSWGSQPSWNNNNSFLRQQPTNL